MYRTQLNQLGSGLCRVFGINKKTFIANPKGKKPKPNKLRNINYLFSTRSVYNFTIKHLHDVLVHVDKTFF